MHVSFLPALVDPQTRTPLHLVAEEQHGEMVVTGKLLNGTGAIYPIVRSIPRFAGFDENTHVRNFGYQWNRWPRVQFEDENVGRPMAGHTKSMWERIVGMADELKGAMVIDFGCGSGRFVDVCRKKGAKVIGLDLSGAVESAGRSFAGDPDVLICQADILRCPIKNDLADGAFSIGVLHHTPDPAQGFAEMARTTRAGGFLAVSVYGQEGYYTANSVGFYRKVFKVLWPVFRHYPPLLFTYMTVYGLDFLLKIPVLKRIFAPLRSFFPYIALPDRRWSILDTFDSVTPTHQSGHSIYEVFQWFKLQACKGIEPSNWGGASVHGLK